MADSFLHLLYSEAPRAAFDEVVAQAERAGVAPDELDGAARRVRRRAAAPRADRAASAAARPSCPRSTRPPATSPRSATSTRSWPRSSAGPAAAARRHDLPVAQRRAEGASYMKVTDGALTPEFRELRLPLGTGLLGLVAQSGAPYFTEDYQADERFVHRDYIDTAVAGEQIRAILGVPLTVEGKVIGALLAVHRTRAAVPARRGGPADLVRRARRGCAGERPALRAGSTQAAADEANAELQPQADGARRARPRPAHRRAAARRRGRRGRRRAGGGARRPARGVRRRGAPARRATESDLDDRGGRAMRSTRADLRALRARSTTVSGSRPPLAGDEHLGTLVLRGRAGTTRTCPNGARSSAVPWSPRWSCSSRAPRPRPRAGCAASCCPTCRAGATSTPTGCASGRGASRAPTSSDRWRSRSPTVVDGGRPCRSPGSPRSAAAGSAGSRRRARGRGRGAGAAEEPLATRATTLRERLGGCHGRRRRRTGGAERSPAAWREARAALDALLTLGRRGEVSDPAGLGLARLLLGDNGPEELEEFVDRHARPACCVRRRARDRSSSRPWRPGSVTAARLRETAERLHVHPNTVTQRLDRVGELLGDGLAGPGPKLDVQLALQHARAPRDM